jgi:hypothetical protein
MLAITIFATIVGDMLPVTDSTPLIGDNYSEEITLTPCQDSKAKLTN